VEYLRGRGVDVSQDADQKRLEHGWSPGVSRIVKWAETIVHIYNVKSGRIDHNLHQLAPEQKVVVVSLTRLDQALGGLKPENIDRVRFRGGKLTLE
jgi:hypothetical protein